MSENGDQVLEMAIEPKVAADAAKLAAALEAIASQDRRLRVSTDRESGVTILKAMAEAQLESAAERLVNEFAVEVRFGAPQVAYRECLTRRVEIDYTYKKLFSASGDLAGVKIEFGPQRPGAGEFARLIIVFEPQPPGFGYAFKDEIVGGAVPKDRVPGVEKGLNAPRDNGVLAGFPLIDFTATLIDGAYHDMDSNNHTFEIAARGAFRELKARQAVELIEPVMTLEVTTPDERLGAVVGDLNARRGEVRRVEAHGNTQVIIALAPLAGLIGYDRALHTLSQGRATFTMNFSHYAPTPPALPDDDPRFPPAIGMRA